jgi:hypothetical protein
LIVADTCAKNAGRHRNIIIGSPKKSSPVIRAHPYHWSARSGDSIDVKNESRMIFPCYIDWKRDEN